MLTLAGIQKYKKTYSPWSVKAPAKTALGGNMAVAGVTNGIEIQSPLNSNQVAMLPFERVPIVWARRIGDVGGVLVSPKATECKFSTPSISGTPIGNAVAVAYHLVVSEGNLAGIQVRDVFHGRCRVGQFSQSYGRRAGTWTRGNTLANVYAGSQLIANAVPAPTFCGTTGTYQGLTTFSFRVTYFNGFDANNYGLPDQGFWKRSVHLFIRNGAKTTRLLDNTYGSSNNLADLYLWLMANDGRTPGQQIDRASLLSAARFMDVNGLFWNGVLSEPTSLSDWINAVGRYFLVRETKVGGRYGLRPLLPVTSTGAINTGALTLDWVFDSNAIEPGSYSLSFRDAESRRPFRAEMAWRQQGDNGLSGITRSTPVYYSDTPGYAPIEEHNLTQFCTSEIHAVRAGMFEQAKRRWSTHTARVTVVPGAYDNRLGEGDLIALQLDREDLDGVNDPVVEWYSVTSLSAGREGRIILDLEHFPVDSQGRSLVALDVVNATAAGDLFITGDSGASCDEDSSRATDTSVPAEDAESRTREEVYFFNRNGRFPNNNEYSATPGGQSTVGNGGIGGSVSPPSNTASAASNPYGPPNWPTDPTGAPADGKPLNTPRAPNARRTWRLIELWETPPDGPATPPGPGIFWVPPGQQAYYIANVGTTYAGESCWINSWNINDRNVSGGFSNGGSWYVGADTSFIGANLIGIRLRSSLIDYGLGQSDDDTVHDTQGNFS